MSSKCLTILAQNSKLSLEAKRLMLAVTKLKHEHATKIVKLTQAFERIAEASHTVNNDVQDKHKHRQVPIQSVLVSPPPRPESTSLPSSDFNEDEDVESEDTATELDRKTMNRLKYRMSGGAPKPTRSLSSKNIEYKSKQSSTRSNVNNNTNNKYYN